MNKISRLLTILLFFIIMATPACQSDDIVDMEISLAPIHDVRVAIAESYPPQVMVYIQGGLSDGCTEFNDLKIERSEDEVTIKVTVKRPRNAVCTQVYGYFEKNVNLGGVFISGQTYTIHVNDKTETFTMR